MNGSKAMNRVSCFFQQAGGGEKLVLLVVLAAVAMLILPIPTGLMDVVLTLNIAFSVVLLLLAFQVSEPIQLATFPSLLLLTTLFRIALNISTCRLILLQADAGEVVRAFGAFVVQGNPLVGGVVFLILTIVQFVVISKGAERVAEVAARFTLDALPGKQMSIDADLRAGAMDQAEAQKRRMELEREAQFHGAMDGAMKFVKGDAIAGMIIIAVNILGGLMVGTLQKGLPAGQAIALYAVLTIGDGLVTQIPALLVSVAAGMVITRVRSDQPKSGMAREIIRQVGSQPQALSMAGGVLLLMGLVPGMPTLPFLLLGLGLIGTAWAVTKRRRQRGEQTRNVPEQSLCQARLEIPQGFSQMEMIEARINVVRCRLENELGIPAPMIRVCPEGPKNRWTLFIDELPVAGNGRVERGQLQIPDEEISLALRRSIPCFFGVQETQDMLDRLERLAPALVREIVPRLVPPVLLAEILNRLIEEEIPIRNLRLILAALAEWARTEADPAQLTERVREALRAAISHRVAPEGKVRPLLLDPELERVLSESLHQSAGQTTLAIAPEQAEAILKGIEQSFAALKLQHAVVLTRPEIRRPLWKLSKHGRAPLTVVSYLELEPNVSIEPAGTIRLESCRRPS